MFLWPCFSSPFKQQIQLYLTHNEVEHDIRFQCKIDENCIGPSVPFKICPFLIQRFICFRNNWTLDHTKTDSENTEPRFEYHDSVPTMKSFCQKLRLRATRLFFARLWSCSQSFVCLRGRETLGFGHCLHYTTLLPYSLYKSFT